MREVEGKGLDYERYALRKLFRRLAARRGWRRVVEIPAGGEKAMPSIYSLPFGEAGCEVTLVNPEEKSRWAWDLLGYPVRFVHCSDPTGTPLPEGGFDLAFNFVQLSQEPRRDLLLREMMRLSRRDILYVGVNRFNPGFFSHRLVHRLSGVPWNHGDVAFMNVFRVARYFRARGLRVVRTGAVDTPPFPDSVGFRDMRLHRMNVDLRRLDWDSRTVHWMKQGRFPLRIRLLYQFERIPMPLPLKLAYAHLFYVLAERPSAGAAD